ncbi:hypothetical protein P879_02071 [Paragonimus westermani]|uniref:Uncharacterized protein n=2 Tax=Paragonimus TaxID=34503 RepID=A0A8T0DQN0_9TREM|nr:hypothetical protein P879_02071 [Paragonimus westermani]
MSETPGLPEPELTTGDLIGPSDIAPTCRDPKSTAAVYLEKHGILRLFQKLTSDVALYRPEDPIQYMIDNVENIYRQMEYN